jgi:dihydrofolate synthase / folylpolyglutamate synthase
MHDGHDFSDAVEYVHSIGEWRSMKLGLERFAEFCARLGDPQERFRSVHVAGTNGKGSTTAMIAGILRSAGYRVGSYYSPFVYDIRERFLLDGEMIPEDDFARLVGVMRPVAEELEQTEHGHPTEFELKTALVFLWFAERKADFAVLEVGLGGRLDATNVINPLVSIITNVTLDHTDRLGGTISEIASEKAGIIKLDGHVVTAADDAEALRVIRETCEARGSALWHVHPIDCANPHFAVTSLIPEKASRSAPCRTADSTSLLSVDGMNAAYRRLKLRMVGDFQHANAATAVGAIEVLQNNGVDIPQSAVHAGLESAYLPGRLEVLQTNPTLIIDGAHNPDGARRLIQSLETRFTFDRLFVVAGMVEGHSVEDVVGTLAPMADKFFATAPDSTRAAPASKVADVARMHCRNVEQAEPVKEAVARALQAAGKNDLVLVTGSFYTINEVSRPSESLTEDKSGQ